MKLSRYLLTLAFGATVLGAVACSNGSDSLVPSEDSDGLASLDDEKKDSFSWDDLPVFDAKADLPSCDKFDGVVAQVIDEKAFFACVDGAWTQIGLSARSYGELPKCNAAMNNFCVDVTGDEGVDASYICDEGTWVKGVDGSCLKGDENTTTAPRISITPPVITPPVITPREISSGTDPGISLPPSEIGFTPPEIGLTPSEIGFTPPEIGLTPPEIGLTPPENTITPREISFIDPRTSGDKYRELELELEKKLQAMQEKFEKEMQDLDDKYEKEMQDLDDKYEKEMQDLDDKYEKEMQDLKNEYEKEKQALKYEFEKNKQALIDEYERRKRGE